MDVIETDTQREATEAADRLKVLDARARRALREAPDLMLHVRSVALSGQSERGEVLPEWTAPMRITAADDSDEVFAQLLDWVMYWASVLGESAPSSTLVAWSVRREVQGFRAGISPEGAHHHTEVQVMWLLVRADRIAEHEAAEPYLEDVNQILFALGAKYPLKERPPRPVSPRPCTACGEPAVGADWTSTDVFDVTIVCDFCGQVQPTPTAADIVRWLPELASGQNLSEACEAALHGHCASLACECFCHDVREGRSGCPWEDRTIGEGGIMMRLTDGELERAFEAGFNACPEGQNDEELYGLRSVQDAVLNAQEANR